MATLDNKKYLSLSGLAHFWTKVQAHINAKETKVREDFAAADATLEGYIGSLTVNGKNLFGDKANKNVVLGGADIVVGGEGTYKDSSVQAAIDAMVTRIGSVEGTVGGNVVNSLQVDNGTYVKTDATTPKNGTVVVKIDDAKIGEDFAAVNQTISELDAAYKLADTNLETNLKKYADDAETAANTYTDQREVEINKAWAAADETLKGYVDEQIDAVKNMSGVTGVNGAAKAESDLLSITPADKATGDVVLDIDESGLKAEFEAVRGEISGAVNSAKAYTNEREVEIDKKWAAADLAITNTIAANEEANATAHQGFTSSINSLNQTVGEHTAAIAALASATHFRGVFDKLEDVSAPAHGDIAIVGEKEYICNAPEEGAASWIELGDVTAETARIGALETWVANNALTDTEIDTIFA